MGSITEGRDLTYDRAYNSAWRPKAWEEYAVSMTAGLFSVLPRNPAEIFFEIVPVFHLTREDGAI